MSKYLKLFETTAEYNAYISGGGVILPNVSVAEDAPTTVYYNPYVDPYGGHDFVEIGGLKWATMNVGANAITDYGLHFQWGDTQGYTTAQVPSEKAFSWDDYKYGDGTNFTKYNETDGKTVLDSEDDAVTAAWGGNWRMPTVVEFQALVNATTNEWTTIDGVNGLLFTDKTDNSKTLFFPATGNCEDGGVWDVGSNGYYWSRSFDPGSVDNAWDLSFSDGYVYPDSSDYRYRGYSVRGVFGE
jgi:hypothetical protein